MGARPTATATSTTIGKTILEKGRQGVGTKKMPPAADEDGGMAAGRRTRFCLLPSSGTHRRGRGRAGNRPLFQAFIVLGKRRPEMRERRFKKAGWHRDHNIGFYQSPRCMKNVMQGGLLDRGKLQICKVGRTLGCANSPRRPEGAGMRDSRNLAFAFSYKVCM